MNSHYRESEYKIYLGYSEHAFGGGVCEGQKGDSYPDREDTHIDFTPDGLWSTKGESQETIGVGFDPSNHVDKEVYMVLVRYSDGDTFGQTIGNWYIEGVYLDDKVARRISRQIDSDKYGKSDACLPWQGYFARLESVQVWGTKIRDGECCGIKWF